MRRAGIDRDLSPHSCRHSWATWKYCAEPDAFRLREAGGWASITQVERYAKLAPAGMRDDILAFWGLSAASVVKAQEVA
jgi:integrase